MKAIVEIDIPADYTDEYKQWVIDGRLYYLEDGAWTFLKEVECELKPFDKAILIEWIEKYIDHRLIKYGDTWTFINGMLADWEKENE